MTIFGEALTTMILEFTGKTATILALGLYVAANAFPKVQYQALTLSALASLTALACHVNRPWQARDIARAQAKFREQAPRQ
jgi:hypothetical protein